MGRCTIWDSGSGKFKFKHRGSGELYTCCDTVDGIRVIAGQKVFFGDSRFFQYMQELDLLEVIDAPEEMHMSTQVPESVRPRVRSVQEKRDIRIKVAEEVERKQQERLLDALDVEDITEAFLSALPPELGQLVIKFDFTKKGVSYARRALRDIVFAYKGQLTMDAELSPKRKREYAPIQWNVNTKWEELTRSQLQSVAKQLSINLGAKAKREELVDAIRSKTKKGSRNG